MVLNRQCCQPYRYLLELLRVLSCKTTVEQPFREWICLFYKVVQRASWTVIFLRQKYFVSAIFAQGTHFYTAHAHKHVARGRLILS